MFAHDRSRPAIGAIRDRAAVRPLGDGEAADNGRHGRSAGGGPARYRGHRTAGPRAQEAGLQPDGLPDLSAEGERDGFYQARLIRELAVRHITSWTGVELEGGPAPPTPENIAARPIASLPGGRAVLSGVHAPPGVAERGKKRLRALCRWHFQPGGGPEYCRACADDGLRCARGEPGADGQLCPYREHALITRQEHEAWEVLLACQGQLRLAPSGHVIGIDIDAALKIGAARGHDLAVLSELLPAAEAGLVEALCADADQRH